MANIDGVLNGLLKVLLPVAAIAAGAFAVVAVLDRMAIDGLAAERRALLARNAELDRSATMPGSPLACLDAGAGETVQNACEKAVFADARSVANAVAYTSARLTLLKDAFDLAQHGDAGPLNTFAGARRAIELDRYGIAAQVLAQRDGCTVEQCPAFALLSDTATLKANLKAQVFDQYVSRHAADWNKAVPVPAQQPVAEAPAGVPVATAPTAVPGSPVASLGGPAPPPALGRPVDPRWDFPSSDSIPAVSIMNAEPKLPQAASEAQAAAQPGAAGTPPSSVPVPPKRPQVEATAPVPAR